MDRPKLDFVPEWQGPIEGFAVNYMNRNLWRVEPEHDFDDLMQDAYLYFLICCQSYPNVSEAKHFMALFRVCLFNHMCYLSSTRSKRREYFAYDIDEAGVDKFAGRTKVQEECEIRLLMEEAPQAVQALLESLEGMDKPMKFKKSKGIRETTNEFLCRIVGFNPAVTDMRTIFESWMKGEPCPT